MKTLGYYNGKIDELEDMMIPFNDCVQKAMSVMYYQTVLVPARWAGARPVQTG